MIEALGSQKFVYGLLDANLTFTIADRSEPPSARGEILRDLANCPATSPLRRRKTRRAEAPCVLGARPRRLCGHGLHRSVDWYTFLLGYGRMLRKVWETSSTLVASSATQA